MANGQSYDGEWKVGLPYGHGKEVTVMGDEYLGDFVNGKRHGRGHLKKK